MKKLFAGMVIVTSLISGCGGSGGGSGGGEASDNGSQDGNDSGNNSGGGSVSTPSGASLEVAGEQRFAADGTLTVDLTLESLGSDDAVYISVTSDAIGSGEIAVSPQYSVVYPTNGDADLSLKVSNNALISGSTVNVSVLTSSNQQLATSFDVQPGN